VWESLHTRSRTHKRFASYVLNTLLGGGMSSRLFQNIRERQGLAYAIYSDLNPYRRYRLFVRVRGDVTRVWRARFDIRAVEDSSDSIRLPFNWSLERALPLAEGL